jgi:hypothetical protein
MNRSTPAPISSIGVTSNIPQFRSTEIDKENISNEKTDKHGILCEMPPLGMPAVTAEQSQKVFGSTTTEMVLPFCVIPWYREVNKKVWTVHCTVEVWLLSNNSVTTVFAEVSECQHKLYVFIRLPEILDIYKVDERNLKLFYTDSGDPIYPENHIRAVSQKMALMTLPRSDQDEVYFKQTIHLPFKVSRDPVKLDGREGVQFKGFGSGIKQMVVELISAKSCYPKNKSHRTNSTIPVDYVSVAGRTYIQPVPSCGSVFSINQHTGVAQPQGPVPSSTYVRKAPPVQQVTTSSSRKKYNYGTSGTTRLFEQVIPVQVPRKATPTVLHQDKEYQDDFFPTPPQVQVCPPLPPPPPVEDQRSIRSVPVGRTKMDEEFKSTWSARLPVGYSTSTNKITRNQVTPSDGLVRERTNRTGSTGSGRQGNVPSVTQGTRSGSVCNRSVILEKVVPGNKRFNECASYDGSSSGDCASTIATHDQTGSQIGSGSVSNRVPSATKITTKLPRTVKKKKRGIVQQLGSGLMELVGMNPNAKIQYKTIREQVESIECEEQEFIVNSNTSLNFQDFDNDDYDDGSVDENEIV